jgi:hypothetical protein
MNSTPQKEVLRCIPKSRQRGRSRCSWLWLPAVTVLWTLLIIAPRVEAQSAKPSDYDVKAAYLYNFGRFVEWPVSVTSKSEAFTVCVLGRDPFGPALDATLANETIAGKNLAAKRITTPQEAGNCQILFLSSAEDGRLSKIIEALDKGAVLTVSDMPQFSQRGGMIQFVLEGKKVRFEVNLTAVQRAGLTLSSELLKVATAVRTNPLPGD